MPNDHLRAILKPKSAEFEPYLENKTKISEPQTTNSISENLRPSTSYFILKSSNDQVEMNNFRENTYSTPHTQYPDMKFVRPGTPYPKNNDSSVSFHPNNCIDDFIVRLVEGKETVLPEKDPVTWASMLLQLEYESNVFKSWTFLDSMGIHVNGQVLYKNFKNRVHDKRSFTDDIPMERLLSVLDGEAKRTVISIGRNGLFYVTATKTLKSNFGNPIVVLFLKLKSVLDLPQNTNENRAGLRTFHQQLKSVITWLNSIGDTSAINLIENTTKAITRLPIYLRSKFYRDFKDAKLNNQSLNLTKFEIWLGNKVAQLFNLISAIIDHQEKQKRDFHKDSHHLERDNRNHYRMFLALGEGTSNYQPNILRCWLCSKDHKIAECNQFVTLSVDERLRLVKINKLCFNYLSNSHMISNCKSKVFCRVDNCKKRHHTLLHSVNECNNSNSSSNDATQNYQTNQHTTIGLNDQLSESPQQSEAAVNTQLGAKHTFLQIIPVKLSSGHIFIETIKWAYFHRNYQMGILS